ncbi:TolC family protein [candidate division KSB1 bacterium]|nr:TolC family protein [candidate division KSB1 bacterium]
MRSVKVWIGLLLATSAGAQSLTFFDCVGLALENNAALQIAQADAAIVQEQERQAHGARLPGLSVAGNYRRQSDIPRLVIPSITLPMGLELPPIFPGGAKELGSIETYDLQVTVVQPLFTGFGLKNRERAHQASAQAARLQAELAQRDLIFDVARAFVDANKASNFLEITRAGRNRIARHLVDVENYFTQGLARREELLRVEVKCAEADLAVLRAENAVALSRAVLENAVGESLPVYDTLCVTIDSSGAPPDLDTSLMQAQATRLELQTLKFTDRALLYAEAIACSERFPNLAFIGRVGYGKPGLDFINNDWMDYWVVGVSAEWSLWNGGQIRSRVQQARLRRLQAEERIDLVEDRIRLDVTHAWLNLQQAEKGRKLARTALKSAKETLRVIENSYRQGLAHTSDVIDAQAVLTHAEKECSQSEADLFLAQIDFKRATGSDLLPQPAPLDL